MRLAKMPTGRAEIYSAVQGEGLTMGKPMTFVRLSICNLHCVWCDTFYTWNFEGTKFDNEHLTAKKVKMADYQIVMTPQEVADQIKEASRGHKNVVFTGGEPLIQQKEIAAVMECLGTDWYAEIETNGTTVLTLDTASHLSQINSSPKLASSGNSKILRHNPKAIVSLIIAAMIIGESKEQSVPLCFKFVVKAETMDTDIQEIEDWIVEIDKFMAESDAEKLPSVRDFIYLMPEGTSPARVLAGMKVLNEIAQDKGFKVSPRLQILTYGEKRAT